MPVLQRFSAGPTIPELLDEELAAAFDRMSRRCQLALGAVLSRRDLHALAPASPALGGWLQDCRARTLLWLYPTLASAVLSAAHVLLTIRIIDHGAAVGAIRLATRLSEASLDVLRTRRSASPSRSADGSASRRLEI